MIELHTIEVFETGGHTVHTVEFPAIVGDPRTFVGHTALLDDKPVRIVAVETHAVEWPHPALSVGGVVVEDLNAPD